MSGPKHEPNLIELDRLLGPGRNLTLTPEWTWAVTEWNAELGRPIQIAGPWDTLDEARAALREAGESLKYAELRAQVNHQRAAIREYLHAWMDKTDHPNGESSSYSMDAAERLEAAVAELKRIAETDDA